MCRSCHRRGMKNRAAYDRCAKHELTRLAHPCGQCGERRKLVECHQYDFRHTAKIRTPTEALNFAMSWPNFERIANPYGRDAFGQPYSYAEPD